MALPFLVILFGIGLLLSFTSQKQPFIWFPSFGSMLKTLGLAVPTWLGAVIVPSLFGWLFVLISVFALPKNAALDLIISWAVIGLLLLVGSFFWYWLLVGLYSLVLRLFLSEVPQLLRWLEPPKKKRDILFGWLALSLAALMGVMPFLILNALSYHPNDFTFESRRYREYKEAVDRAFAEGAFIVWFIVCAYFYQIRGVCRHAIAKKRKAKRLAT